MNNTDRFTKNAEHYQQYRPNYPKAMINLLTNEMILSPGKIVADIGSGTGIFTEQLLDLKLDLTLLAVEPNHAMRHYAKQRLHHDSHFTNIDGSAEQTTLPDNSVDVISVATAFHWFNLENCQKEFRRILRNNGDVLIFWNIRQIELAPILQDYDDLLKRYCSTYRGIPSKQITDDKTLAFFAKGSATLHQFTHQQQLNLEGLVGRLRSTSYALTPEHPQYDQMIKDIVQIFNKYQHNNYVIFPYLTRLFIGKI